MALTPTLTRTSAQSITGILMKAIEVTPDGGNLDIRIYKGTDTSGTEVYSIRAVEKSEFRYYPEGVQLTGMHYLQFYSGDGAVTIFT